MRTIKHNNATRNSHKAAAKVVYHPRRAVIIASEVLVALAVLCFLVPSLVREYRLEADAKAFIIGIATSYKEAAAEDERAYAEAAIMKEHHALRTIIYCEAPRLTGNKPEDVAAEMYHLADAVFSRVDSPNYPDTVQAVVTEERIDRRSGKKVAMYSPLHTECFNSPKNETADERTKWKMAGKMASIAFKERWDGKASSGNTHFLMDYVNPAWKTKDVANCLLKPKGQLAGFHLYFAEVLPQDRAACYEERKLLTATVMLPKHGPIPAKKPKQEKPADEVAALIHKAI